MPLYYNRIYAVRVLKPQYMYSLRYNNKFTSRIHVYCIHIILQYLPYILVLTAEYTCILYIPIRLYAENSRPKHIFWILRENKRRCRLSLPRLHPQSHSLPPLRPFYAGDDYPHILSTVCVVKIFLHLTATHVSDHHGDRLFDPCTHTHTHNTRPNIYI